MQSEDNLSLDSAPFIYSLTNRDIPNFDIRRIMNWYTVLTKSNSQDASKISDKQSLEYFGQSERFLSKKYDNIYIYKYWSNSSTSGYAMLVKASDIHFDLTTSSVFVKTNLIDLYTLGKSTAPKLIFSENAEPLVTVKQSVNPNNAILVADFFQSRYKSSERFEIPTRALLSNSNDWINFSSLTLDVANL